MSDFSKFHYLCSDLQHTYEYYFHWGKFRDEMSLWYLCIGAREIANSIFALVPIGALSIFNKMWFSWFYVVILKNSNFLKILFHCIRLSFLGDFRLIRHKIEDFWSFGLFWPLAAFVGLYGLYSLELIF